MPPDTQVSYDRCMAHVTFIHGIANKVDSEPLLRSWIDALRDDGGPDLWSSGVTTSMCYWADVLYEKPLPESDLGDEAAGEEADIAGTGGVGMTWFDALDDEEKAQVLELAAEVGAESWLTDADLDADDAEGTRVEGSATDLLDDPAARIDFERIPLPGPLKRRMMKAFLRDVHHYLWDVSFEPRPGDVYQVRTEIRQRTLDAMAAATTRPHVVVGHSLGSVIAYDVLRNVADAPSVDGLLTLGSPLGLDEVQDHLKPGWSRWDGYPALKVRTGWTNVYDRLDPVCGFDPVLANDFRRSGSAEVVDIWEPNRGRWRHSVGKYLGGSKLRATLVDLLELR